MTTTPTPADPRPGPTTTPIAVELVGRIADDLVSYAREKIGRILTHGCRPPVGPVHVRVVRHGDPARERPVTASVHVDLPGTRLDVHHEARTARAAVDGLVDRLGRRVRDRVHRPPRPHHRRFAGAEPPTEAVPPHHEVLHVSPTTLSEALAVLVDLDDDLHPFVERATRRVAVVRRVGPDRYLVDVAVGPDDAGPPGIDGPVPWGVEVRAHPLRRTTVERALEHLRCADLPFLLFDAVEAGVGSGPGERAVRLLRRDRGGTTTLVEVRTAPTGGPERGERPVTGTSAGSPTALGVGAASSEARGHGR